MNKILIRAGMSPFENHSASEVLLKDSIGANSGNLLYQYSIFRQFSSDSVHIIPNYYSNGSLDIDKINREYKVCIMPFANSFRSSYRNGLKSYTELIKKLEIPVIVIGIGLQAPLDTDVSSGFPFDKEVKDFVNAVLEKSSMLGLRGQITADYLSSLGFEAEKDFTVTGCPSMYAFGNNLSIKKPTLTKKSSIYVNSSPKAPADLINFIDRTMSSFPNYTFVPQDLRELELVYTGSLPEQDMKRLDHNFLSANKNDRIKYFINIRSWFDNISKADLTIGARMHGNIASVLSGTPSIIFPIDTRTKELSEYHGLPSFPASDIKPTTTLSEVIDSIDWDKVLSNHERNYDHYLWFLEKNGIKDMLTSGKDFDLAISKVDTPGPIKTFNSIDDGQKIDRLLSYYPAKNSALIDEINSAKKKVKKLKNKLGTDSRISIKSKARKALKRVLR